MNERQIAALLDDESAIEALEFRDRDDLIVRGLAIRVWPTDGNVGRWRTWLTAQGHELRIALAAQQNFVNAGRMKAVGV